LLQSIMASPAKMERAKSAPQALRRTETPTVSSSRRVVAVQRALTEYGYGQIKLTGIFDEATKAAVEKFERGRKLPVSGQISDRLMRELAAITGRPLE
jgi:peptidoglycan hydrolase-like protein with peptidoglycan-binding domain